MELIENQMFEGETVTVDGKTFKACSFDDTTFVYRGGDQPTFVNCQFGNVTLQFEEDAANTLKFLSGIAEGGFGAAVDKIINGVRQRKPAAKPRA